MHQIALNIRIPERTKIQSERAYILSLFKERIDKDREGTRYKPIDPVGLAIKLSHVKTNDLMDFFDDCKQAKHFSKYFFWALRVDNSKGN